MNMVNIRTPFGGSPEYQGVDPHVGINAFQALSWETTVTL